MGDIKWIKLYVDIFSNSRKIKKIERLKNGDSYIVIWFKLLCLAGLVNDGGMIYVTPSMPFEIEDLVDELKRPKALISKALDTFEEYEMIERSNDGFIRIVSWGKYQDVEILEHIREQNRIRKQNERERKKSRDGHVTVTCDENEDVTGRHALKREENNKYITLSNERVGENSVTCHALSDKDLERLRSAGVPDEYVDFCLGKIKERGYQYEDKVDAVLSWWSEDKELDRWSGFSMRGSCDSFDSESFFEAALRRSYGKEYDTLYCASKEDNT